jgi:hypothetical protein
VRGNVARLAAAARDGHLDAGPAMLKILLSAPL